MGFLLVLKNTEHGFPAKPFAFAVPFAPEPHVFLPPQDSVEIYLTYGPVPFIWPVECAITHCCVGSQRQILLYPH